PKCNFGTGTGERGMIRNIVFNGFKDDGLWRQEYSDKINQLLDEAPYESNAFSTVRRTREGAEGTLKIYSSNGRFVARAFDQDCSRLADRLIDRIRKQMQRSRMRASTASASARLKQTA